MKTEDYDFFKDMELSMDIFLPRLGRRRPKWSNKHLKTAVDMILTMGRELEKDIKDYSPSVGEVDKLAQAVQLISSVRNSYRGRNPYKK